MHYLEEYGLTPHKNYKYCLKESHMNIEVLVPMPELFHALGFIQTLENKNKAKYKLTIVLDYLMDAAGQYLYKNEPNKIYLNPDQCKKNESYGYTDDDSLFGTTLHEFCHYLSMHYFKNFHEEYLKEFPEQRIVITSYDRAQSDYDEEIAEIMSLHLRNPYFLKLIAPDHYKFMSKWIKPYIQCTQRKFIEIYNMMKLKDKERIFNKWNIIIEHDSQTVIRPK
jgi:hypothetical protein